MGVILTARLVGNTNPIVDPLLDRDELVAAIQRHRVTTIVHNAEYRSDDSFETYRLNILALTNIIYAMKRCGITDLILVSSTTYDPNSYYDLAKLRMELIAVVYAPRVLILRLEPGTDLTSEQLPVLARTAAAITGRYEIVTRSRL